MSRCRLLVCLLSCWGLHSSLAAHEEHDTPPRKVAAAEQYRPSPIPDRVILTWTGDPATTQAVTWRTDRSTGRGKLEWAVATDGTEFAKLAQTVTAVSQPLKTDLGEATCHTVELTELQPKTTYAYRVGDGVNWSEWHQFTTASAQPEPFSFIYFGDAQNDVRSMWSRVIREAFREAPRARFFLHAGDLINKANADAEWGEWFSAGGWANGAIASLPTPGNHEYALSAFAGSLLSSHWRPQFALPTHGPAGLEETVYWIDYQGVRIIALNSNEKQAEQVPWLEAVLKSNPHRWSIVTFHHPIHSAAKSRDNPKLRALWGPVLDKYKVDLVLQGHDHTYARTGLVGTVNVPEGTTAAAGDTVYVVSVSGPKFYNLPQPTPAHFQRVAEETQLFQVISIDGNQLTYAARTATGRLYDGFTLTKSDSGKNTLTEAIPPTPPRLRKPMTPTTP